MDNANAKRGRADGKYTYSTDWNRVCARCGNTLGRHSAEKPHDNFDLLMGPECEGFKKAKVGG